MLNAAEVVAAEHKQQDDQHDQGDDNDRGAHRVRAGMGWGNDLHWLFGPVGGRRAGNTRADFIELHAAAEKCLFVRQAIGGTSLICHNLIIPQTPRKTIRAPDEKPDAAAICTRGDS